MGRPPLPLGTWGRIRRYQVGPKTWRAVANYRDYDGVTRPVERRMMYEPGTFVFLRVPDLEG